MPRVSLCLADTSPTKEWADKIIEGMHDCLIELEMCRHSPAKKAAAITNFIEICTLKRDFMRKILESDGKERHMLVDIYGSENYRRIAGVRAVLKEELLGEISMNSSSQDQVDSCIEACETVEAVLKDLGAGEALEKAQKIEKEKLQRRRAGTPKVSGSPAKPPSFNMGAVEPSGMDISMNDVETVSPNELHTELQQARNNVDELRAELRLSQGELQTALQQSREMSARISILELQAEHQRAGEMRAQLDAESSRRRVSELEKELREAVARSNALREDLKDEARVAESEDKLAIVMNSPKCGDGVQLDDLLVRASSQISNEFAVSPKASSDSTKQDLPSQGLFTDQATNFVSVTNINFGGVHIDNIDLSRVDKKEETFTGTFNPTASGIERIVKAVGREWANSATEPADAFEPSPTTGAPDSVASDIAKGSNGNSTPLSTQRISTISRVSKPTYETPVRGAKPFSSATMSANTVSNLSTNPGLGGRSSPVVCSSPLSSLPSARTSTWSGTSVHRSLTMSRNDRASTWSSNGAASMQSPLGVSPASQSWSTDIHPQSATQKDIGKPRIPWNSTQSRLGVASPRAAHRVEQNAFASMQSNGASLPSSRSTKSLGLNSSVTAPPSTFVPSRCTGAVSPRANATLVNPYSNEQVLVTEATTKQKSAHASWQIAQKKLQAVQAFKSKGHWEQKEVYRKERVWVSDGYEFA